MKSSIILVALLSLTAAKSVEDALLKNGLQSKFKDERNSLEGDKLTAINTEINEFVDKICENFPAFAEKSKLEPILLDNIKQQFLTASIELTHGKLNGLSHVYRDGDVTVTYDRNANIITLNLPLLFKKLSFTYDYHVVVFLVGPTGGLTGSIDNFRLSINLSLDLNKYQAKLNKIKTSNSGHITVKFDGHLSDVILNIMSQFVTTALHPILQGFIEAIVKNASNKVVDGVNKVIDEILNPDVIKNFDLTQYQQYLR
ncbi:uncharacterized protein LOC114333559 isoform X1 [Diabrotica virgifera virgifera]|uniref:Circadian clock-controlled protein-like n=1 Tax=Diabrotica virgifera virgifera TaxID=50390 RepID=A0ABM5IR16_DIAVI|nr:uncharacterized protein LOC114333559 isoform X1 [Diabrotica virgifera virgifera]